MAHFAEIKQSNNEVVRVLVFSNDDINAHGGDLSVEAEQWVATTTASVNEPVYWKQTSYNNNFRHKYADLQDEYHPDIDQFRQQKPIDNPSFVYNEEKKCWLPPIDQPQDGPSYDWDEASVSWVLSPIQTKAEYLSLGTNTKAFDPNSDELYFPN